MSENRAQGKKRILVYVLAAIAIVVIGWIIFRGTNIFNYMENLQNAAEEQTTQQP